MQKDKNKEFLESLENMLPFVAERVVKIWLHPTWIYKMTSAYRTEKQLGDRLFSITRRIKEEKQKEYDLKNINSSNDVNTEDSEEFSTPQIFIDELLKLWKTGEVSETEITEQVYTIIITGNETSSLVLSNTILMLAMYPEHQEKVVAELRSIPRESEISLEYISQLTYLDMVVKEVMRLFPVGPLLARNNLADIKISNCIIPANTFIVMSYFTLHRDPKSWGEHPNEFNPDNFLPERIAARHPYAYLPFCGGTRNCIGMKYAWISLKIVLTKLLLNFKFSSQLKMEEISFRWDMTLKVENRHWVTVEKRVE
ncbi:Cytochrome P450 4c3, partial [Pseudolycoriella hygida]